MDEEGGGGGRSTILRLFFVRGCLSLSGLWTPRHRQRTNQPLWLSGQVCVCLSGETGKAPRGGIGVAISSRVSGL